MHTYFLKLACRCPNNNAVDIYEATISTTKLLQAEDLLELQSEIYDKKMYQEDIWKLMEEKIRAKVLLVGDHMGVRITCGELTK